MSSYNGKWLTRAVTAQNLEHVGAIIFEGSYLNVIAEVMRLAVRARCDLQRGDGRGNGMDATRRATEEFVIPPVLASLLHLDLRPGEHVRERRILTLS
jgi:hypothetical protein